MFKVYFSLRIWKGEGGGEGRGGEGRGGGVRKGKEEGIRGGGILFGEC